MELSEIIVQKIREAGPVSFKKYMELCLYHPDLGYYMVPEHPTRPAGDYYTCASLTPVFGIAIGRQLEEMWNCLNRSVFTIVEVGGGPGLLCKAILSYLRRNKPMYDRLRYYIVEKNAHTSCGPEEDFDQKVTCFNSLKECPAIEGCILSNELLDNFPVHQVVMQDELKEVFVDYRDGFVEILQPAGKELRNYFSELNVTLPENFRTEVNLAANSWMRDVADVLNKGYILTIDYGYLSSELYQPSKSRGTLLSYYKHSVSEDYFSHIGRQDITSHINFSALIHWGNKYGFRNCGFTLQCYFLLSLGIRDIINEMLSANKNVVGASAKAAQLYHTLLMDMGSRMKVLIQEKGGCCKNLSGLKILYRENRRPFTESDRACCK
ncbi:hypothetical protein A8C56_02650 [Niabella ginsenosidivorans]|uniref:SAM-dependent methyltransferase n=1 Tax=Niabella ginsenosidivorans TaxID=1176587 RepID=A0A1A9IAF5_9BACT|nr:SAM-dependent methyltransferase [Niabella ginsenosidivorans]ANH83661.1 hypothetical protein A8C56_02650 [Niabella ginsenosidivorans]